MITPEIAALFEPYAGKITALIQARLTQRCSHVFLSVAPDARNTWQVLAQFKDPDYPEEIHASQIVASFRITALPGCSPVGVFNKVHTAVMFRGIGVGKLLHEFRVDLARYLGYQLLLCTVETGNVAQTVILNRYEWTRITVFHNPKTGNTIGTWMKSIGDTNV